MPAGTTTTVLRDDGTAKEMSQRQLGANLEPGDLVKGPAYGTGDLVQLRVTDVGEHRVVGEIVGVPDHYSKIPYGAIVTARLEHAEREA